MDIWWIDVGQAFKALRVSSDLNEKKGEALARRTNSVRGRRVSFTKCRRQNQRRNTMLSGELLGCRRFRVRLRNRCALEWYYSGRGDLNSAALYILLDYLTEQR